MAESSNSVRCCIISYLCFIGCSNGVSASFTPTIHIDQSTVPCHIVTYRAIPNCAIPYHATTHHDYMTFLICHYRGMCDWAGMHSGPQRWSAIPHRLQPLHVPELHSLVYKRCPACRQPGKYLPGTTELVSQGSKHHG